MKELLIISAGSTKAIFPLLLPLLKSAGIIGAKKNGLKKMVAKTIKDEVKDKIKETIEKKDGDKEKEQ